MFGSLHETQLRSAPSGLGLHNRCHEVQFSDPLKERTRFRMATSEVTLESILQAVPQGAESVFPKAEYDARLERLRGRMEEKGFDLVLLSGPENVFYLCGQQTPGYYAFQSLCVPVAGEAFVVLRAIEAA